ADCSVEGGLVCVNNEQKPGSRCLDYEIRFLCPKYTPTASWSSWIDRDDASGTGDWEDRVMHPIAIECRTVGTHIPASRTNQVFMSTADCSVQGGLVCQNSDQNYGSRCLDYEVRYLCPK
ncbi:unnamed protein product, partial [Owenia fusiformis]